jgi:hypothetical protein
VAKQGTTVKQAAGELGVSAKWVRRQIASGTVTPARAGSKRNGRFVLTAEDVETLRVKASERPAAPPAAGGGTGGEGGGEQPAASASLARVTQLETERANLLARVAWERAIAQSQQKALDAERERTERLEEELRVQRARVEALKALSAWDRALGRHKAI